MKGALILIAFSIILSGCQDPASRGAANTEAEGWAPKVAREGQVGRFQFYPASGEMSAVLLDTETGCVETFEKVTSLENPKDVRWLRRYADGGLPLVTYENGRVAEVPDSAPPKRCFALMRANK